ncbi:hypothetical protein GCM10022415_04570 [Knoellia locipacati]|uniref:O-antigen ligase-related domain-containing protein n=1 Tax=Knoellia locipacati TaxID=882824 RepID=A0A512SWS6_9MICO|nr:O-antigen ligase family protein [Knoellia locipacati]GEQ12408.1 hypothetical protein KLO01_04550 [Knoellia locipacati]
MVLALGALAIMGLIEYVTGVSWEARAGRQWLAGDALGGPYINPNNYASFLVAFVGPTIVVARRTASKLLRFSCLLLIVLAGFLAIHTLSRTAVIAGLLVLCVGMLWPLHGQNRHVLSIPAMLLSAGVAALLFSGRIISSMSGTFSDVDAQSDEMRVGLAQAAAKYAIDSDGLGIGPGSFVSYLRSDPGRNVGLVTDAHNTFLQIGAEYGVIVFVPVVWMMFWLASSVLHKEHGRVVRWTGHIRLELSLVLIGVLAGGLSASSLIADGTWWLLIGYSVALAGLIRATPSVEGENEPAASPDRQAGSRQ